LYGVSVGQVFFGESMFSLKSNASKVGFTYLCEQLAEWGYELIDCQVQSEHLDSLGAATIIRDEFTQQLELFCIKSPTNNAWQNQ